MEQGHYGIVAKTSKPYDEALEATKAALKAEGFGVLTEVDVQATLKEKIGADFRRYDIIGACNPPLAHRALTTDLEVGLLLPCNVIVYEDDAGGSTVAAFDPLRLFALSADPALQAVAEEARARLERALAAVED